MRANPEHEQWVDLVEAVEATQVPRQVIVDAIAAGRLQALRMHPSRPGEWLVRRSEVMLWAALRYAFAE